MGRAFVFSCRCFGAPKEQLAIKGKGKAHYSAPRYHICCLFLTKACHLLLYLSTNHFTVQFRNYMF